MRKILMRGGKTPFEAIDPLECRARNVWGDNVGNYAFLHSVFKSLWTEGVEIVPTRMRHDAERADEINGEYESFVIPLANAFRPDFVGQLDKLTALVRKLKIPCVVVGAGAQASLAGAMAKESEIADATRRFVSAVLDKSASIGVRGEYTYDFVRGLGFSDAQVDVIGCPSAFYFGPDLALTKKRDELTGDAVVSFHFQPSVPAALEKLLQRSYKLYPRKYFIQQHNEELDVTLFGKPMARKAGAHCPKNLNHALAEHARFFCDLPIWIAFLRAHVDFAFGSRIHGTLVSALAGIPCFIAARDSRTLELAEYHDIPRVRADELDPDASLADIYAFADFASVARRHAQTFPAYLRFLEKNGLRHIWDGADNGARFEARLRTVSFPEPVLPITQVPVRELARRLS